jgi:molecular chaperone DnaJ
MVVSPVEHRDYYEILGVPREATAETIKAAFHQLARRYHPDRSKEADAEERFEEISEAYSVLSDTGRRAEYDRSRPEPTAGERATDRFGSPRPGRLFTFGLNLDGDRLMRPCAATEGGVDPFGRGPDIRLEIEIPLDSVAKGVEQTVEYSRLFSCPACGGGGTRPGSRLRLCAGCGGAGRVPAISRRPDSVVGPMMACQQCGGTGLVIDDHCPDCSGSGMRPGREWLKVRIPPGIEDGTVLRVRGRGLPGRGPYGRLGDLYLVVRSAPDPGLVRSGADLWRREAIPVTDAVLGVRLDVTCLGQTFGLDVPPGTQGGTVLRLAGRGLPRFGRGEQGNGDLCVIVDVVVPSSLSSDERKLYEQLRDGRRRFGRWLWRRRASRARQAGGSETP